MTRLCCSSLLGKNFKYPINEVTTRCFFFSLSNFSNVSYMNDRTVFIIDEQRVCTSYKNLQEEMLEYCTSKEIPVSTKFMFGMEEIAINKVYKIETLNAIEDPKSLIYVSKEMENFGGNLENLVTFVKRMLEKSTIIFALENTKQINEIKSLFDDALITNEEHIHLRKINIIEKKMNHGFAFENILVITPYDIDKSTRTDVKYKNTIKIGCKVKTYTELANGDYIVHEQHGIGIYRGLKAIKNGELKSKANAISSSKSANAGPITFCLEE